MQPLISESIDSDRIHWKNGSINLNVGTSDIWSYGITVFEIFTKGDTPYKGQTNEAVIREIILGYRLWRPDSMSEDLYEYLLRCWVATPEKRPNFDETCSAMTIFEFHNDPLPVKKTLKTSSDYAKYVDHNLMKEQNKKLKFRNHAYMNDQSSKFFWVENTDMYGVSDAKATSEIYLYESTISESSSEFTA